MLMRQPARAESLFGFPGDKHAHLALVSALRLYYQPIIRLSDMQATSVEVLARAKTENGDIGGPETIVAAMTGERDSMALTGAVLRHAIMDLRQAGLAKSPLSFAVNLPLDAMLHPGLVKIIRGIRGTSAQKICFELTERHPVRNIEQAATIINMLRDAGYRLALDDVTPDTPNLAALIDLPIDAIKLDTSVVNAGTREANDFIRKLTAHAAAHGQHVVAEGIETPETLMAMKNLNVSHGQGFLFAHPAPAAKLAAFLSNE